MSRFRGNPWAILLTVCLGFFMTLLDLTIVNIAIPDMIDKLHASLDEILWVVNGYTLVLAVLIITAGRLGDLRGQRSLFLIGVVVFTLASALCGLAQSPTQLIGARVLQGLGAAILLPQTMAILVNTFPSERRGAAMGIWGAVAGVATIAGPTLGGFLVTAFDWRWIFFINVPVGALVLFMTVTIIPEVHQRVRHRMDLLGVALASAALFCFAFGLTEGERYAWGEVWSFVTIPLILGLGGVLTMAFLLQQRSRQDDEPLLPFALFRDRNYALMNFTVTAVAVGMLGTFLPITIYLQSVLGYSALAAGLTLAPMSVVSMFVAPVAGRLTDRVGGKYLLMAGLTLFAAGIVWVLLVAGVSSTWQTFVPGFIVAGFGMGLIFSPMNTIAMRDVERRVAGAASGVLNTFRQLGAVIGAAAVGALLQAQLSSSLRDEAVSRASVLPPPFRDRFVDSFRNTGAGVEVGAGQTGAQLPQNLPAGVAEQVRGVAEAVFTHGYVTAMKPTIILPIGVVLLGVIADAFVKQRANGKPAEPEPELVEAGV